mmetsp:Transcript_21993/g.43707  ORF Transcript_21993/g.43707 Transcript_21993/m.43707 type:complete len:128 (+) Transcript_21993:191-574(+)
MPLEDKQPFGQKDEGEANLGSDTSQFVKVSSNFRCHRAAKPQCPLFVMYVHPARTRAQMPIVSQCDDEHPPARTCLRVGSEQVGTKEKLGACLVLPYSRVLYMYGVPGGGGGTQRNAAFSHRQIEVV